MKDDFVSLLEYNRWADRKVLEVCRKLTPEQFNKEPVPGWSSIQSSLAHIAIVIDGWLRGVAGENVVTAPKENDLPTVDDIEKLLEKAYANFEAILPTLSPEDLATVRVFEGGGHKANLPPWGVLRHIVNHGTYHRGQIASKLKRLGIDPPGTDLVFWLFEKVPQK